MFGLSKVGILDPEGKNKNPLTGKKYSEKYREEAKIWSKLPIYVTPPGEKVSNAEKVIRVIQQNRVVVLESGTGSGKTVCVPKYALHTTGYRGKVIVTVPKQVIAESNATRDAVWMDVVLGEEVGYQYKGARLSDKMAEIKGDSSPKSENTKLLFSTDGSLVQMLNNDPKLSNYSVVVIDEAHERSTGIDEALLYMRRALRMNPKLKLIVMSATLPNSDLFLDYFQEFSPAHLDFPGKPNKPVDLIYSTQNFQKKDEIEAESLRILFDEIIAKDKPGDVLIFVNSGPQANNLRNFVQTRDPSLFVVSLYSGISDTEKDLATKPDEYKKYERGRPKGGWKRRVVFSTNVAESSITVDGLKFVIDPGTELDSEYNTTKQQSILHTQMITKAQADQRKGRVGRKEAGTCYRLYTLETFNKMRPQPEVTIVKEDMTSNFLKYISSPSIHSLVDLVQFVGELIEPPPVDNISSSIRNLISLSLVSSFQKEGKLTDEGVTVSKIATAGKISDVMMAKSILVGKVYGCEKIVIIMGAILQVVRGLGDVFFIKDSGVKEFVEYYKHPYGDLFSFYKVFFQFSKHHNSMTREQLVRWSKEEHINLRNMEKIKELAVDMFKATKKYLEDVKVEEEYKFKNEEEAALFSLIKGYFPNIAKMNKGGKGKKITYTNFYPFSKTTASFDTRGDSYFSMMSYKSLPQYMFYITNSVMERNATFKICNVCPKEMIKLLQPEELVTLHGLKV